MEFPIDKVALKELLIEEAKKKFGDNIQIYQNGLLGYWINALALLAENDLFYTISATNESFLSRAIQPSSILEHAKSFGYTPLFSKPCEGEITIYITIPSNMNKFNINYNINQLKFQNNLNVEYLCPYAVQIILDLQKGINVCYLTDSRGNKINVPTFLNEIVTLDGNALSLIVSLPIIQARILQKVYTISDRDVIIGNSPIIDIPLNLIQGEEVGNINVYVNGIKYKLFNYLFSMSSTDLGYVLEREIDSIKIILGNGTFGYKPKVGSTVLIEINFTFGESGYADVDTLQLMEPLIDSFTSTSLKAYTSNSLISNGINGEDFNTIRLNTIYSLRNGGIYDYETNTYSHRLVTEQDFIDFFTQTYNSTIESVVPIVKRSDSFANDIHLFIVPKVKDLKVGYRPLKCTSGVIKEKEINTTTVLLSQNEKIDATKTIYSNGDFTNAYILNGYISPFEVIFYKNEIEYVGYNYLIDNITYIPVILSKYVHTYDYTSYLNVVDVNIYQKNDNFILKCNIDFYINETNFDNFITNLNAIGTENLFSIYDNLKNLDYTDSTTNFTLSNFLNFEMYINDLNTKQQLSVLTNNWKIYELKKVNSSQYKISLIYRISSTQLNANTYQFDYIGNIIKNNEKENVFKAYNTNIYFKYDLTNLFPLTYALYDENKYTIYNIPLIEEIDFFTYEQYIKTTLFPSFLKLKKDINKYKMLTTNVTISFAKTHGYISNIKYNNPYNSSYVYLSPSYYNSIELPLKYTIEIVPKNNIDIEKLIEDVKLKVYTFLNKKKGIHSTIYITEIIKEIMLLENISDVDISLSNMKNLPLYFNLTTETIPNNAIKSYIPEYIWINSTDDIHIIIKSTKELT